MAAYAAVASLVNTIEQIMIHPCLSASLDNDQIQPLHGKAGLLLDFFEGYNYGGVVSKEVEDLEKRITCAAHEAEDVIESRIVDQIHGESESWSLLTNMSKKVKHLKRRIRGAAHGAKDVTESDQKSLNCSIHLQQIVRYMDTILIKANELKEKEELALREEQPANSRPDLVETGESAMVGFEDELIQIMDELTNQRSFHVTNGLINGTERRLIIISTSVTTTTTVRATTLARSISAHEVYRQELDKHILLRVLDAWNHESVEESFRCFNLRYLALEEPNAWESEGVWELPTSVSLLWNLHTLIFGKVWIHKRVVAPIEIWKMRQLRHIKCPKIYLPHPSRQGMSVLENLQMLKTLVNFRLSEEVCKLIPNIQNLHLVYDRRFQGYDDSLIQCLCNLSQLLKLESLKLKVGTHFPIWNSNLKRMLTFPTSLNKLSLRHCQLHWDDLTVIGSLPLLQVLKLDVLSVTEGREWNPLPGQFLRLKFLMVGYCELTCWNAESVHFPVLEKLVLRGMSKLEEIPCGIGEIPTLKLICVENCRPSATVSAVKIKEDRLESQGDDDLQIEVFSFNLESFVKMMQVEGLKIDNVTIKQEFEYF